MLQFYRDVGVSNSIEMVNLESLEKWVVRCSNSFERHNRYVQVGCSDSVESHVVNGCVLCRLGALIL